MNYLLGAAKQALLEKRVDWRTDPIFVVLVDTGTYTFSPAHASLADVPPWARIATSGTLTNRTTTNGVADADDVLFSAVAGNTVEAVALFNGTNESALYMCYMDQAENLPFTPTGGPGKLVWDNSAKRIFQL
jgi:hypothetical protein